MSGLLHKELGFGDEGLYQLMTWRRYSIRIYCRKEEAISHIYLCLISFFFLLKPSIFIYKFID
jgi:hypothetical protein